MKSYDVLDTPPEKVFDDLARLAAGICGTESALVTCPRFCTSSDERVYITAKGCETLLGGGYGLPAAGAGGR